MTEARPETCDRQLWQIAREIHHSMDLGTIWQQAANGLGRALDISHCVIGDYTRSRSRIPVVAEYCRETTPSLLGRDLKQTDDPFLTQAIDTIEPVVIEDLPGDDPLQRRSLLVVPGCYQNRLNSLIALYRCSGDRYSTTVWSEADIDFARQIADCVGTAIDRALLYQNSSSLARSAASPSQQMLSNLHDKLRNPLNAIIGSLQLILDELIDDPVEQREFIQDAHLSALSLVDRLNNLLNISKFESDCNQLELEQPVSLNKLLTEVERFIRLPAQQKQLDLTIELPETSEDIILTGNYWRLLQVMLNVTSNAIKFTPRGNITIQVQVLPKTPGRSERFVEIQVSDTGIGVPPENRHQIFEPFMQGSAPHCTSAPGTGLGLAISRKLIEAMGGTMDFYSAGRGLGSTIRFTVPRCVGNHCQSASQPWDRLSSRLS